MQKKHIVVLLISVLFSCQKITTPSNSKPITFPKKGEAIPVVIQGSPNQSDGLPFDWTLYEDENAEGRPEFWDDGADGTLPRPFLYLAEFPTPENGERVVRWQKRQWETIKKIIKAMGGGKELETYESYLGEDLISYLEKNEKIITTSKNVEDITKTLESANPINWKEVTIVEVYASSCPACQKSIEVVNKAKSFGANVLTLQTDFLEKKPLYVDSKAYTGDWIEYFPHKVTPTFYLKYGKNTPVRSDGYLDFQTMQNYIKKIGG